jgi:LuxR family maltose regulon positive regulatory protein
MNQVFHSNVSIPSGNQIYLKRPQIDRLLEKAVQNPVVIVSAGAGYGKTQAVYSFVRTCPALVSWIQLSERDNNGERFWENFTAGVTLVNPRAAAKLVRTPFPETGRDYERYLAIPTMDTERDKKYIFVYDDFHLLRNKAVLRFLERSVTSPFPNITSIIITRTNPSIDLIRLQSRGLLGRLTEDELRFSQDEMVEYFRLQGLRPPPQTVSSIYRDTEGWAFAIHLAGLSLKNAPPGAEYAPQAMRSNIFKLLESEIISVISPELRRFLIKLSLIDQLSPELLRNIAAPEDPKAGEPLIQEMEQIGSFIRFDTYLNEYRIHHLLLEYLSGKQQELSETEKRAVYRQAAGWCAANNQKMDALSYYERAGDYDQLIAIADSLPLVLPSQLAKFMLELLDRFPPEVYAKHPRIHAVRARTLTSLSMFERCGEELKALIPQLEALPPSPALHWLLMALYANFCLISIITSTYTRDYSFPVLLERAAYHGEQTGGPVLEPPLSVVNIGSHICRVQVPEKEEMERFISAITKAVSFVPAIGGCGWGMDVLARAELAFFKGNMPEAEALSRQSLRRARDWGQYEIENRALFYLLRISLARGDLAAIADLFQQMEEQLDKVHYVNRFIYHDIVTGWYETHIGRTDKLAAWLKDDFEESDLNFMARGLEVLVKAKYHFAEKRYPAALAVLVSRQNKYDAGAFVLGMVEITTLEALCRYRLRDKEAAFAALETACRLSRPNGLEMPFTEMGKDMRALAGAALKEKAPGIPAAWLEQVQRNASVYAKKLFLVTEQRQDSEPAPASQNPAGLSRREREVLTGLSQGLTREEIAGFSSISVNTVKSVIRSIYNKLGAANRADAIRIATSLGLV